MASLRARGPGQHLLRYTSLSSWLLAGLLLLAGCASDDPDLNDPAGVSPDDGFLTASSADEWEVPGFWVLGNDDYRTVFVTVTFPDGVLDAVRRGDLERPVLTLRVQPPAGATVATVEMHDDGGALELSGDGFTATTSGDLVPGDGVYALRINSGFATLEGDYEFEFLLSAIPLSGAGTAAPPDFEVLASVTVSVSANQPPEISNVDIPADLPSGFAPQTWTVTVTEPNADSGDEVVSLNASLIPDGGSVVREFLFARGSGSQWTFSADSSFSAGLMSGDYVMALAARDQFDEVSEVVSHELTLTNAPPVIANLVSPDTVYQADTPEEPNLYLFTLDVSDQQSPTDIETVYYTVTDPNGNYSENEAFVFRDDGEDVDAVAGDGVWTHGFIVTEGVSNFGTYTFRFYADDRGGNTSNEIVQEIELRANTEN